ncbi:MAG: IPTL-CTERM sorting domain-containing protein, partial [Candidatus Dadabacteria bacterium]|nr:IPTL-CTERM sorting domain-containing protein [Candidatus Dadabacteria bacterium]
GVSTPKGNAVIYRNRSEGNIKIVTFDNNNFAPFGGTDPVVRVVGKDPDFNGPGELGFYGFGCTATPDNPNGTDIGFVGPNGKRWDIDLDTGKIFESRVPTPTKNTQSGPNSMNPMCNNTIFTDGFESGDVMAWSNTVDSNFYAQFIYVLPAGIPTLGQWGLISLGLILLIIGAFYLRRRKVRA